MEGSNKNVLAINVTIFLFLIIIVLKYIKLKARVTTYNTFINYLQEMNEILYCCEVTPKFKYYYLSPSINKYFGENAKKAHMENPNFIFDIVHPEDRYLLEAKKKGHMDFSKPSFYRLLNEKGEYVLFEDVSTPIYKDGQLKGVVGVYRAATENMDIIRQLEQKLKMDSLTSTFNREHLQETMMILNNIRNVSIGLAVVDLDNLKQVNDQYGHKAGDSYIVDAGNLLKKYASDQIFVSRYGGDEFVVLFIDMDKDAIQLYFDRIFDEKESINKTRKVALKFSVGYAYSENSIGQIDQLFIDADQQMYVNKTKKKNNMEKIKV